MTARVSLLLSLGRAGYEAYAAKTGGKTFDGRDMPAWDALPWRIQGAWSAAADAIEKAAIRAAMEKLAHEADAKPPPADGGT